MHTLTRIANIFSIILFFTTSLHPQEATITEETRTIKTYPFSDADPVPVLARRPNIYPYFETRALWYNPTPFDQSYDT